MTLHDESKFLVGRLTALQANLKLSNAAFVARFRDARGALLLGSERTWERMKEADWSTLNLERWTQRLRETVGQIDGGTPLEDVYDDLPFYRAATAELARLEGQTNDRRVMVILAITGTGKTIWARSQARSSPATRLYLRATPAWRESGMAVCVEMARCLGIADAVQGQSFATAVDLVANQLRLSQRTVIIDEAHDGGIPLMKLIRHWIDTTNSRFVYMAYPTEWSRVLAASRGHLAEAKQFIGRSLKPILDDWSGGPTDKDVIRFIARRAGGLNATGPMVKEIAPIIRQSGGLRLLADGIADAAQSHEDGEFSLSDLLEAVRTCAGETVKIKEAA